MRNKLLYPFQDDLRRRLKNPEFKKAWEEFEPEYVLAKQVIEKRLAKKISQRRLAKKLKTTQAVISRLETMRANPTLSFLKKIAQALDSKIQFRFE